MKLALVIAGGGLGSAGRYLVSLWMSQHAGTSFPWGTLSVNIVGSFLIALVMELSIRIADFPPNLRLALTTGLMGGLTTYSAFNFETTQLAFSGHTLRALANVVITIVACLAAGLLGLVVARRFGG